MNALEQLGQLLLISEYTAWVQVFIIATCICMQ